jgi:hypothetical protein
MNSLFIGLGGAGISAVAEFAKKAKNQNLNQGNEFVYIDTDEYVLREYPYISEDFLLLSQNLLHSQNTSPEIVYRQASSKFADASAPESEKRSYKQFLQWFDADNPEMRTNRRLDVGSDGVPMLARTLLFANYGEVRRTIFQKLAYLYDDFHYPKVYVVSGTCGGTGNGILLDILYMLNDILNEGEAVPYPGFVTNLVLVMPEGFNRSISKADVRYHKYHLNAYALFDEINACLKDYCGFQGNDNQNAGMQWHKHRCFDNDEVSPFQFEVYKIGFIFDSIGCFGQPLSRQEITENIANFLLLYGEAQPIHPIFYNNTRAEKFNSRDSAFIKGFAATGTFVAQTWEELTRKYVHDKFIHQMLRYGFLGSEDFLPQEQLKHDVDEFCHRIDLIIHENDISSLIENVLDRSNFDELTRMMDLLKEVVALNGKTPAIEEVMNEHHEGTGDFAQAVISLLSEVHRVTCAMCSQWAMKYNLRHALQIVERLDIIFDSKYKQKSHFMVGFEPGRYFLKKTEKRREELHQMLQEYVKYLVYRNLSNEDDGYLDHCKHILHAAIREVENKFHDCRIDGIRVEEWEHRFIKDLYGLMNNPTKAIYPNLENLIDNNTSLLREGNEVERNYAAMVRQDKDGKRPDMSFDAGNPFLLYTHKQKCIDAISQRNDEWAKRFDITFGNFAKNVTEAFEVFAKEVVAEAALLSASDCLRKPFSNLVLSQEESAHLASRISASSCGINTDYMRLDGPKMDFVVADFNNLPWLQNAMFPHVNGMPAYNSMENVEVQNTEMPDRITKLHFEFGQSFDDYLYFDDYRLCFEDFLRRYRESPSALAHQPFVDKRFLTERREGETLADMFAREAAEDQQN